MPYATLSEGHGYLSGYASQGRSDWIDKALLASTEAIDARLSDWDRSTWQHGLVPPEVRRAAEMLGAAEYILLAVLSTNPGAEVVPAMVTTLRKEAGDLLDRILTRGTVMLADGSFIRTRNAESPSGGASGRLFR